MCPSGHYAGRLSRGEKPTEAVTRATSMPKPTGREGGNPVGRVGPAVRPTPSPASAEMRSELWHRAPRARSAPARHGIEDIRHARRGAASGTQLAFGLGTTREPGEVPPSDDEVGEAPPKKPARELPAATPLPHPITN